MRCSIIRPALIGVGRVAVFVIEDDEAVRDALVILLSQFGHQVLGYPDAESFLTDVLPGEDDVVLIDLGLPGLPGNQLLRWLNALAAPPRVVVISGQSQSAILDAMRDFSAVPVLRKPLTVGSLSAVL